MGLEHPLDFAMVNDTVLPTQRTAADVRRQLWHIYTRSLKRYVASSGILARSLQRTEDGWVQTEPDPLNTLDIVKAAFLLDRGGIAHDLDARALLDRVVTHHLPSGDYQIAALTLWAAALGASPQAETAWQALVARMNGQITQSMALGWVLSAVCAYAAAGATSRDVAAFAGAMATRLLANQNRKTALFYPSARREGWLRRRRADTTLSSQTFPIYALSHYATLFDAPQALTAATACADRLCQLQGELGQWWWRFDARRSTVGQRYPVFAVNQDGTVPVAFGQLQAALGDRRYDAAIDRGLVWEGGANELGRSLLDARAAFVARALEPGDGGYKLSWEMYGYQPGRGLLALMSDSQWLAQARG